MIKSPLTNEEVVLEKEINYLDIEKGYQESFNIEVGYLLKKEQIKLFKCTSSGYKFYFPYDISGDSEFYSKLQQKEWYYMKWKWEHEICKEFIRKHDKVLEVGCAEGDFIKRIKEEKDAYVLGLELNKNAIECGRKNGIEILDETVEEHAKQNKETYDIVCSFQVLEHISEVKSFLQSKVDCLKRRGKLIIAVPNNSSFIKFDHNLLNLPPHHMGLWTPESIKSLEHIFNIKLLDIQLEPLQEIHFQWFYYVQIKRLHSSNLFLGKVVEYLTKPYYRSILKFYKNHIIGHTMLAIFEK